MKSESIKAPLIVIIFAYWHRKFSPRCNACYPEFTFQTIIILLFANLLEISDPANQPKTTGKVWGNHMNSNHCLQHRCTISFLITSITINNIPLISTWNHVSKTASLTQVINRIVELSFTKLCKHSIKTLQTRQIASNNFSISHVTRHQSPALHYKPSNVTPYFHIEHIQYSANSTPS